MGILAIVRVLLKGSPKLDKLNLDDATLQLYIDLTVQRILNYCNRNQLPEQLVYTAAQMVIDILNEVYAADQTGTDQVVSSISEDGRTVSFATNASKITLFADDRISRTQELIRFKLLYKT